MTDKVKLNPEEFLAHLGVKGMRWGTRKQNPTGSEIKGARTRQAERHVAVRTAKTPSARNKASKDVTTNEDRVTASRMTIGEKIVATMLGGPVGLIVISRNKSFVKGVSKKTDAARDIKQ
jgi:hypothetical protein